MKKSISPVVAIALLLVTAVVGVVGFQSWYNDFSSQVLSDTETRSSSSVSQTGIDSFINGELYFNNGGDSSIGSNRVKIGDVSCDINQTISTGTNEIQACGGNYTAGEYEVVVYTDDKIYSKKFFAQSDFNIFQCLENGTNGFHGGDGSSGDPYEICNCVQLQAMNDSLISDYELVSNVDCSATSTWNWNGTIYNGFFPIGMDSPYFSGDLEGNNYQISNLFVNRSDGGHAGLLGRVSSSEVSNLRIYNSYVVGRFSAAGIGGYFFGDSNLTNLSVTDSTFISDTNTGGITASAFSSVIIKDSYVRNIVTNSGANSGGAVGVMTGGTSSVNNTYVVDSLIVGGSYAAGTIGSFSAGEIYNSYTSNNDLSASASAGGIAGFVGGNVSSSYWNNQTTDFIGTDTTDSGAGSQQTTSALQSPTTNSGIYANWSTSVWDFGTASQYPSLQWE